LNTQLLKVPKDESQVMTDSEIWEAARIKKQCNHQTILATLSLLNFWCEVLLHPVGLTISFCNIQKGSELPGQISVTLSIYSFNEGKGINYTPV
jgi:hypothetical protein